MVRSAAVTRLTEKDLSSIADNLNAYDSELFAKTGCSLRGVACRAAGVPEGVIRNILKNFLIGVIPISGGRGVIPGFCNAVAGIVSHLGCNAFITQTPDVAGLAEAFEKKADIIMLADDQRFIALNTASRQVADNAIATARGFVAGLGLMAGDLNQKKVLVIGCGPVGRWATEELVKMGVSVCIYDINPARSMALAGAIRQSFNTRIQIAEELERSLVTHRLIIDASPATDIIQAHHITAGSYISAPGVPIGLDRKARLKIGNRLLHDTLQIGAATMVISAIKSQR